MIAFNFIEAALWFVIAFVLCINALYVDKYADYKKVMLVASVCFLFFGVSDIIEAYTGAWWKPRGLLVLNISCVTGLALSFYAYRVIKSKNKC